MVAQEAPTTTFVQEAPLGVERREPVATQDYYSTLGVSRNATEQEIKKAYRALARKLHPDVNKDDPNAEERFKEATRAYEVLSNPQLRQQYDQYGHAAFEQAAQNAGAGPGGPFGGGFGGFDDLGDIFDMFFGGGQRRGRTNTGPQRGSDLRYDLDISFQEAAFGATIPIELPRHEACEHCKGSGAEPGTEIRTCPQCNGRGEIQQARDTPFGRFVNVSPCHRCRGEGRIPETTCSHCMGRGVQQRTRKINVRIPAGVEDGQQIRLSGEGEAGARGGPPGDLYVFLTVRPHQFFQRDGANVLCEVPITFTQAALGAEIEVPTLEGQVTLRIPDGTQTGKVFRLRGQGIPHLRGTGRGDQLVRVRVVTPTKLTSAQREALQQFAKAAGEEPAEVKNFFERVRDVLGGR